MTGDIKVSIRNLYKIFGPDPASALQHVYEGTSKTKLLSAYGHVLGLRDINIDIHAGNITVVMRDNKAVGILDMNSLVRALVPRAAPDEGARKY